MSSMYLTWAILLVLTILLYILGNRDLINPSFVVAGSFFIAFTVVMSNTTNWGINYRGWHMYTTLCILITIISFAIGCGLAFFSFNRDNKSKSAIIINSYDVQDMQIDRRFLTYPYVILCVVSGIFFVLFFYFNIKDIDFSTLSKFKNSVRINYDSPKEHNVFTSQILEIIIAIAYISFHRIMLESFYLKQKVQKLLFIPILIFLFAVLLYTDRNILLRFILFSIAIYIMFYKFKWQGSRSNVKLFLKILVVIFVVAVMFWVYGILKNYKSNFERAFGIYAGSGLYGFDIWLNTFTNQFTGGEFTFSTLLNTINAFGFGEESTVSQLFEFVSYTGENGYVFETNIYSALRVYYQDFGIFGIVFIPLFMGIIFGSFYPRNARSKVGFLGMFYCAHIYHVVYFPILEQFLLRFHLGLIYEFFWLSILYYIIYYGKYRIRRAKFMLKIWPRSQKVDMIL